MFRELWMLVDGVLSCFNLLLWAGIIVGVVIYMFAVAALETITKSETFKDNAMVQDASPTGVPVSSPPGLPRLAIQPPGPTRDMPSTAVCVRLAPLLSPASLADASRSLSFGNPSNFAPTRPLAFP